MPSRSNKKTIAVVDDHYLFRKGLIGLIEEYKEFEVIFDASNGVELLQKLKHQKPHAVLLDVEMPEMNGVDATIAIRKKYPEIKIIILSMHGQRELVSHMLRCGAHAYLTKNEDIDVVIERIDNVLGYNSESYSTVKRVASVKRITEKNLLSARETEVVKLLCEEYTNREIADILSIGQRTVDTYRKKIFAKIGAKNLAGVVLYAISHNIISRK